MKIHRSLRSLLLVLLIVSPRKADAIFFLDFFASILCVIPFINLFFSCGESETTANPISVPTNVPTAVPITTPISVPTTVPTAVPITTPISVPTTVPTTLPTTMAPTASFFAPTKAPIVFVPCKVNSDCMSGRCDCDILKIKCACLPQLEDDEQGCNENSDCVSGRCECPKDLCLLDPNDSAEGFCRARLPPGSRCDENSDCQSGDCFCGLIPILNCNVFFEINNGVCT